MIYAHRIQEAQRRRNRQDYMRERERKLNQEHINLQHQIEQHNPEELDRKLNVNENKRLQHYVECMNQYDVANHIDPERASRVAAGLIRNQNRNPLNRRPALVRQDSDSSDEERQEFIREQVIARRRMPNRPDRHNARVRFAEGREGRNQMHHQNRLNAGRLAAQNFGVL